MENNKAKKIERLKALSKKEGPNAKWKQIAQWNRKHADALDDFVTIASHIRKTLDEKNWTQADLADKLEVTPQALTRIMKGRQNLTLQTIRKIENILNVNLITVHQNKSIKAEKLRLTSVSPKYKNSPSKEYKQQYSAGDKQQELKVVSESGEFYNRLA